MSHDDLGCDGDHSGPVCADPECWLLPPVDLLTPSAPERIWLCISDDEDHYAEPFPDGDLEGITWCDQKPCACTVEYVRADIAERAEAERDAYRDAATARDRNEDAMRAENERLRELLLRCYNDEGLQRPMPDDVIAALAGGE